MLLVVHAGLAVAEPGALDPLGPDGTRCVVAVGLRLDRQAGGAGGAFRDGFAKVGQLRLGLRGQPPPGERLADHAIAAPAGNVAAPHQPAPRPEPLGDPAGLDAEQLGLVARVVRLVLGQCHPTALGELRGLRHAVGGPVIANRRPVVLVVIPRRREVRANPVRGLAPILGGEGAMESRQRPIRLAGEVLGVLAGVRRPAVGVIRRNHGPRGLGLRDQEAPEAAQQRVVTRLTGGLPAIEQPGGEQRSRARLHLPVPFQRRPAVALDQPLARPFESAVGGGQRSGQPRRRRLIEAHRHPGVSHRVVRRGGRVLVLVVEVEPGAVSVLVAHEPAGGGLR